VLLDTGRPREALARVERAMAIEPLSAEGLRLLGRAHYELKQVPQAIDAYQRAIALDERDVWALNNLGLIYIQQDRSDAALPILAQAVAVRSDSPVFQNNLGTALERSGRFAAARQAYQAAIAADSTYGKASASLARVTPHAERDTGTVDLAALVAEFQAELERWRGVGEATDTSQTTHPGDVLDTNAVVDTAALVE
jgi:tetratricopeptide (TPR) repeat protein